MAVYLHLMVHDVDQRFLFPHCAQIFPPRQIEAYLWLPYQDLRHYQTMMMIHLKFMARFLLIHVKDLKDFEC